MANDERIMDESADMIPRMVEGSHQGLGASSGAVLRRHEDLKN